MAHRALLAYERPDGRYDVHAARWGGFEWLVPEITPTDPYAEGAVDPEPRVTARPFESVRTMVDFARHEALYRVDTDYAVEAFLPLWLALDHYLAVSSVSDSGDCHESGDCSDSGGRSDSADRSTPEGLLVAIDSATEAARLRRWLRAAKAALAEAVEGEYLTHSEAEDALLRAAWRRIGDRAAVCTNDHLSEPE